MCACGFVKPLNKRVFSALYITSDDGGGKILFMNIPIREREFCRKKSSLVFSMATFLYFYDWLKINKFKDVQDRLFQLEARQENVLLQANIV